jgi:uncharacterized membrane protein/uncharacterized membrane-anchored protein
MIEKKQIEQWLKEGLITHAQAQKMVQDVAQQRQQKKSYNITLAFSVIGSLLLGIGAILFVASNWQTIPNAIKVALLMGGTIGVYGIGYLFEYKLQNLPIVGAAFLFLGSLLFGATIFLIAQMYHVSAHNYTLILIWLGGILPLVYVFSSASIAVLSVLLSYVGLGLFLYHDVVNLLHDGTLIPVVYLLLGAFLFSFGSLHYFFNSLKPIGRIYRLAGIHTIMLSLFFLSFKFLYESYTFAPFHYALGSFFIRPWSSFLMHPARTIILLGGMLCAAFIFLFSLINALYNPSRSKSNTLENVLLGVVTLSALLCFFVATPTNFFLLLFNSLLIMLIFLCIVMGYRKEDIRLVNAGMFWLIAFITARYFDFFWNLISRSLFFMIGGLLLVLCSIVLERKRRELKAVFEQQSTRAFTHHLSRKKYLFLTIGILWIVMMGGYLILKEHMLQTGQEVILKTAPVDPRDLFRGDYVRLQYPMSEIDITTIPIEKNNLQIGDTIFVALARTDSYAQPFAINTAPKEDTLAIRGTIRNRKGNRITVEYGIESYFVPEHKGREIERMVGKDMSVQVVITKSGKALIKAFLIDGKEVTY